MAASADDPGWVDETSAALRELGFKIIRFGTTGMVYVGQVDYNNRPDGHGFMFLASGDVHECDFRNGRAQGQGTYVTAKGSQYKGTWDANKRVGNFEVMDANGVHWIETYNAEGKAVSKKKVKQPQPNPKYTPGSTTEPETIEVEVPAGAKAQKCWNCNHLSHPHNNHQWACRSHKGNFTEDLTYRGDGPRPGVWSCCGREQRAEPGCAFRPHNYMT